MECLCVWVVGGYSGGASESLNSFLSVSTTVTPFRVSFLFLEVYVVRGKDMMVAGAAAPAQSTKLSIYAAFVV